jgi:hypothetical protein
VKKPVIVALRAPTMRALSEAAAIARAISPELGVANAEIWAPGSFLLELHTDRVLLQLETQRADACPGSAWELAEGSSAMLAWVPAAPRFGQ